jgi:hypothetical protein
MYNLNFDILTFDILSLDNYVCKCTRRFGKLNVQSEGRRSQCDQILK